VVDTQTVHWQRDDWYCHGVLDGTLPVERIHEDAETVAFYAPAGHQLNEEYETHIYVIPKRHIVTVLDLTSQDAPLVQALLATVQLVARKLKLDERGFYIRANVMPPFQHTGHIHIHLLSGERER
jgi:histidine triad (HIT) family protein